MKVPFISVVSYRNCKEHLGFLSTQYYCVLSNGITLIGTFNHPNFNIHAVDVSGKRIGFIHLESHIAFNEHEYFMYLIGIQNETEIGYEAYHGIGCLMLQLLLSFIADYNKDHPGNNSLINIRGSINPIGTQSNFKDYNELRTYYQKRNGLTDFQNRICIEIDSEKCKKNDLLYSLKKIL